MTGFDPSKYLIKMGRQDYLEVKWRLVWLRDVDPDAALETEAIRLDDTQAIFRATVRLSSGGSATGYGSETPGDFRDYIEKSETKAIGRALAHLGYGTQFAGDDLSEGTDPDGSVNVVDTPGRMPPNRTDTAQSDKTAPPRNISPMSKDRQPERVGGGFITSKQRQFLIALAKDLGMTVLGPDGGEHHDEAAMNARIQERIHPDATLDKLSSASASKLIEEWQAERDSRREQVMDDAEQERIGRLVDAELAAKAGGVAGDDRHTR
jgi:hypothetical protein